jgi:hypothetical protein
MPDISVPALVRRARLALALSLSSCTLAQADSFRVCSLPVDTGRHVVRFCPTGRAPVAGAACQCDLQSVTLQGRIGSVEISGASEASAGVATVCLLASDEAHYSATFCPSAPGVAGAACQCAGDSSARPGQLFAVQMLPRYFLRGNAAAESDFLKRLRECCVVAK